MPPTPRPRRFSSRSVLIWAGLTALLAIGVLVAIFDLAGVPAHETMRSNSAQQRVIIDPFTGVVSGLSNASNATPFEVADDSKETPLTAEPSAPSATDESGTAPAVQETPATPVPETAAATDTLETLSLGRDSGEIPKIARAKGSLVAAPAPEISKKEDQEVLPVRGSKGAQASALYARSFTRTKDGKLVAIVVTDVGFNNDVLKQVLDLPPEVSVGFSPYAEDSAKQIAALRNKGHEVWAMLPMMGAHYPSDDPGPLGLIGALTVKGALTRLHTVLANTIGSVGVILPPDETFSQKADLWGAVRDELETRGLYILSTHPTRDAKGLGASASQEAMIRRSDMILDSTPGAAFIRSKLASIGEAAGQQPELVVLVSARPQALALLADWLKGNPLDAKTQLAPLSAIYVPTEQPAEAKPPAEKTEAAKPSAEKNETATPPAEDPAAKNAAD